MSDTEKKLSAFALALKIHGHLSLSDVWRVEPFRQPHHGRAEFVGQGPIDGLVFVLNLDAWDRRNSAASMEVYGRYPTEFDGTCWSPSSQESRPEIGLNPNRPPKDLAQEIERRFLPEYIPMFHQAVRETTERRKRWERTAALARELAALLGVAENVEENLSKHSAVFCPRGGLGRVEIYSHSDFPVRIGDSSLSVHEARTLFAVLAKLRQGEPVPILDRDDWLTIDTALGWYEEDRETGATMTGFTEEAEANELAAGQARAVREKLAEAVTSEGKNLLI